MQYTDVSAAEVASLDGLDDWRVVLRTLCAEYRATSFSAAAALVAAIADAADEAVHHPDVGLRYPGLVRVVLTTHETGGLTTADTDLARQISSLAAALGATSDPMASQAVEIAIDTMDADAIRPFWKAVLGYSEHTDGALHDPAGLGPALWFQQMEEPRTDRDRFHIDVSVPHDAAADRIEAALAAGGVLVSDRDAKAWWVLADVDGNEACVCTWQDR